MPGPDDRAIRQTLAAALVDGIRRFGPLSVGVVLIGVPALGGLAFVQLVLGWPPPAGVSLTIGSAMGALGARVLIGQRAPIRGTTRGITVRGRAPRARRPRGGGRARGGR